MRHCFIDGQLYKGNIRNYIDELIVERFSKEHGFDYEVLDDEDQPISYEIDNDLNLEIEEACSDAWWEFVEDGEVEVEGVIIEAMDAEDGMSDEEVLLLYKLR